MRATVIGKPKADFSDLVCKWVPDPAFDEILSTQRQLELDRGK